MDTAQEPKRQDTETASGYNPRGDNPTEKKQEKPKARTERYCEAPGEAKENNPKGRMKPGRRKTDPMKNADQRRQTERTE